MKEEVANKINDIITHAGEKTHSFNREDDRECKF